MFEQCPNCNLDERRYTLIRHGTKTGDVQCSCPVCGSELDRRSIVNLLLEKKYECEVCKAGFAKNKYLKQHLRTVHRGMSFPCSSCWRTYARYENLSRHMKMCNTATPKSSMDGTMQTTTTMKQDESAPLSIPSTVKIDLSSDFVNTEYSEDGTE